MEVGGGGYPAPLAQVLDLEFQYAAARRLHFHQQGELVGRGVADHSPGIDHIAVAQLAGVAALAPEAGPADQPVSQAANPPQDIEGEKVALVAYPAHLGPQLCSGSIAIAEAGGLLGVKRVARFEVAAAHGAFHPVGGQVLLPFGFQCRLDLLFQRQQLPGHQGPDRRGIGFHIVFQTVDQCAGNVHGHGGHQSQPVG